MNLARGKQAVIRRTKCGVLRLTPDIAGGGSWQGRLGLFGAYQGQGGGGWFRTTAALDLSRRRKAVLRGNGAGWHRKGGELHGGEVVEYCGAYINARTSK